MLSRPMKILTDYQITIQHSDHGSGKTLIGALGCILFPSERSCSLMSCIPVLLLSTVLVQEHEIDLCVRCVPKLIK